MAETSGGAGRDIRVIITPGSIFTAIFVVLGLYLLWVLRDLVLLVITAIVIASAIEPGVAFFVRHKVHRFVSVLLMYVLVFGFLFALLYFFFPPVLADAGTFFANVPQYLNTLPSSFSEVGGATQVLTAQEEARSVLQTLLSLQSAFTADSVGTLQLIATFFGGIFSLFLVIVLSFYLALQETGVSDFLRLVLPSTYESYAVDLWRRSQRKIGLWMQGQILLSVIVGVLVYLGLLILGVPYALLLAVIAALAEIIPIFGSLFAGLIAVVVAFSHGGIALALIVVGLYIVVNQFEANLIYPLVVQQVVGLPPLIVILALIAGGILAGFLGILLSVPVAATILELLSDFEKKKRRALPAQTS